MKPITPQIKIIARIVKKGIIKYMRDFRKKVGVELADNKPAKRKKIY